MKSIVKICFLLIIFILSCKDSSTPEPQQNIKSTFQPYYDKFLEEANKRGMQKDYSQMHMTIRFKKLKDTQDPENHIAYCLSNLQTIVVDSTLWIKQLDMTKELIIFHEIGHCLLGRSHLNLLTESNEFRSMMYGEPIASDIISAYSFNYWGNRREYYIDELFNSSTQLPSWANLANWNDPIKTEQKTKVYEEILRSAESSKNLILSKNSIISYENEAMKIVTSNNGEFISIAGIIDKASLWKNKSFEIEIRLKLEGGIQWNLYGPTFEVLFNEQKRDFLYSYIANLHLGSQNTYWQQNENVIKQLSNVDKNAIHILKVRNDNNLLYWFFDNHLQYISENLSPQAPQNFSFSLNLDKNTTIWLYSIKVSEIIK